MVFLPLSLIERGFNLPPPPNFICEKKIEKSVEILFFDCSFRWHKSLQKFAMKNLGVRETNVKDIKLVCLYLLF